MSLSAGTINALTFNGGKLTDDQMHHDVGYLEGLTDESLLAPPLSGPYTLDISLVANAIHLTLSNDEVAHTVELPIRGWKRIIAERMDILDEYYQTVKTGTAQQIDTCEKSRRQQHDASAEKLQETCEAEGIGMDFETARNVFACLAPLVAPTLDRAPSSSGERDR